MAHHAVAEVIDPDQFPHGHARLRVHKRRRIGVRLVQQQIEGRHHSPVVESAYNRFRRVVGDRRPRITESVEQHGAELVARAARQPPSRLPRGFLECQVEQRLSASAAVACGSVVGQEIDQHAANRLGLGHEHLGDAGTASG